MPSTKTITSYYTFTANTKARASQVNANFSNYRGHILPVEPLTIAAIDNTYDLGGTDYSFRAGYFGTSINLQGETTTSNFQLVSAGTTAGSFNINIDGTVSAAIHAASRYIATQTGTYGQLVVGSRVLGDSNTSGDSYGFGTIGAFNVADSTLTVASTGKPIEYSFFNRTDLQVSVSVGGIIFFQDGEIQAGGGLNPDCFIHLIRDGVTIQATTFGMNDTMQSYKCAGVRFLDLAPPNTSSVTYELGVSFQSSDEYINFVGVVPYIKEWQI